MVRDQNGRIRRTLRRINTRVASELLVGDGWQGVAYAELMRLSLEVSSYHQQLKGKPGFDETGRAAQALKEAYEALNRAYSEEDGENGDFQIAIDSRT